MHSQGLPKSPNENPDLREDQAFTTSDTIDAEGQKSLGPSAFEGTDRPYLARVFDINTVEIRDLGLREQLADVDSYILALVKERKWVDTESSYRLVLEELKNNLGFHPNLEPLRLLGLLSKGVRLLKLQTKHRRRDAEIQKAIQKLNLT